MRQRTKIGEFWRIGDGVMYTTRSAAKAAKLIEERRYGGKRRITKITRWRLAPLVRLSAWERVHGGFAVVNPANSCRRAFIELDGDPESEDGYACEAFVYGDDGPLGTEILASRVFESIDITEVQRWVEDQLRIHGYRIIKASAQRKQCA